MQSTQEISINAAQTQIAEWLGLHQDGSWRIYDSNPDEGLYLINYNDMFRDIDRNALGWIRGLIVHLPTRRILVRSYGYAPTIVSSLVPDVAMEMYDEEGRTHVVDPEQIIIRPGHEGAVIRIWKWNGKVYRSTHRRLQFNKSRWGQSKTFEEMYADAHGPSDSDLFGDEPTSPWVYYTILMHPQLLNVTKLAVMTPSLIWLGAYPLVPSDTPVGESQKFALPTPQMLTAPYPEHFTPENLTPEQGTAYLNNGWYPGNPADFLSDNRLYPGEFVMAYLPPNDSEPDELKRSPLPRLLKIQSPSYTWRMETRDNNPNLYHRFFQMLDGAYCTPESYVAHNPVLMALMNEEDLIRSTPMVIWPQHPDHSPVQDVDGRITNNWRCLVASLPMVLQPQSHDILGNYFKDRKDTAQWLWLLSKRRVIEDEVSPRVPHIISTAKSWAKRYLGDKKVSSGEWWTLVRQQMYELLMEEMGQRFYEMNRDRKRIIKLEATASSATA